MPYLSVPHVKQEGRTNCGVACLEMVYRYFGIPEITQQDIWEQKSTMRPDNTAAFMETQNMVDDLVERDFHVLVGQFYLDNEKLTQSIESLLSGGIPIIACTQWAPDPKYGHFVVIVGIEKDEILYLDPEKESVPQKMNIETFMQEWQDTGEEVIGGQFIVMGKDKKKLRIEKLHLTNFSVPSKLQSFCLDSVDFLP